MTGEEMGLLGSDYFAHFPTVAIQNVVADVNMDEASISYAFKDVVPLGRRAARWEVWWSGPPHD